MKVVAGLEVSQKHACIAAIHVLIEVAVETSSIDSFPFVGPVPNREGHFIAAGFAGHGRSYCSTSSCFPQADSSRHASHPTQRRTHYASDLRLVEG